MQVHGDSVAYLLNNEIFSNKYSGVGLTESSSVSFGGGNKIHGNGDNSGWRAGVGVYHSSQAIFIPEVAGNKDDIYGNNGPGVFLSENCGMLMKSAIVRDNHGDGVTINMGSFGQFESGAIIEGNDGYGINCTDVGNKSGQPGSLAGNGSGETTCQ